MSIIKRELESIFALQLEPAIKKGLNSRISDKMSDLNFLSIFDSEQELYTYPNDENFGHSEYTEHFSFDISQKGWSKRKDKLILLFCFKIPQNNDTCFFEIASKDIDLKNIENIDSEIDNAFEDLIKTGILSTSMIKSEAFSKELDRITLLILQQRIKNFMNSDFDAMRWF